MSYGLSYLNGEMWMLKSDLYNLQGQLQHVESLCEMHSSGSIGDTSTGYHLTSASSRIRDHLDAAMAAFNHLTSEIEQAVQGDNS